MGGRRFCMRRQALRLTGGLQGSPWLNRCLGARWIRVLL